ncbi:alpha/beta hydrolase [Labrys monachus]|uniref:Palmitoyl-protein thioesterase ABHD10, mitochondrial n=1 Tax=Labrys monachus TaxID=217067 RepID=A0ABU0FMX5_9HYPH|nr:alpha/beta hydrolase [Labrys monachus]MDQ0395959.1 pimeloyl-ACP methyl ester carboxylesterase [Labrys monachus]
MTGNPATIEIGEGASSRAIAWRRQPGRGPDVVWLGGFRSDMLATKASALAEWGLRNHRTVIRFDYSGHGESGGRFEDGTIGRWLEDALAVIAAGVHGRPILVGSSMGGWIALLACQRLAGTPHAPAGLVLVAPAVDFTERLMWDEFPEAVKREVMETGAWMRPSAYSAEPYPITRALIEEGRGHLLLGRMVKTGCPVHILQGMEDPDVPWHHAMTLVERLAEDDVTVTLIKDGDHRLSRPEDIGKLVEAVEGIAPKSLLTL